MYVYKYQVCSQACCTCSRQSNLCQFKIDRLYDTTAVLHKNQNKGKRKTGEKVTTSFHKLDSSHELYSAG